MSQPRVPRSASFTSAAKASHGGRNPLWIAALLLPFSLLLVVPMVRAGQAASDARQARATADAFLRAFASGDRPGVERNVTQVAREKLDGIVTFFPTPGDRANTGYVLRDAKIENDTAEVPATLTRDGDTTDARLQLVRENRVWKVRSVMFILAPGGPFYTLNLEHPENAVSEGFRTLGQGMGILAREFSKGAEAFEQGFQQGMGTLQQMERNNDGKVEAGSGGGVSEDAEDNTSGVSVKEVTPPALN